MLNLLHKVQINKYLKRTFAIKAATMKIMIISIMNGSHHVPTTLFAVSKDEWGTGKSTKNVLYV